jgi:hypothetical protein
VYIFNPTTADTEMRADFLIRRIPSFKWKTGMSSRMFHHSTRTDQQVDVAFG